MHTVPKSPKQNGTAEQMNITLVEILRSKLIDAKPHSFRAEAVCIVVYLINRSRTKANEDMTPFEAWMKQSHK